MTSTKDQATKAFTEEWPKEGLSITITDQNGNPIEKYKNYAYICVSPGGIKKFYPVALDNTNINILLPSYPINISNLYWKYINTKN